MYQGLPCVAWMIAMLLFKFSFACDYVVASGAKSSVPSKARFLVAEEKALLGRHVC